jgi:hypothetical protein
MDQRSADDKEAMQRASDLSDDRHAEIWEDERLVIRMAPIPQA